MEENKHSCWEGAKSPPWGRFRRGSREFPNFEFMEKDKPFYFGTNNKTFQKASALRKEMTDAEKILWNFLRRKNVDGFKFRRQHPLGQFIADFYCHEALLVIEVDGKIHLKEEQKKYDEIRSRMLNEFGLRVIRFTNEEVMIETASVIKKIEEALATPTPAFPQEGRS